MGSAVVPRGDHENPVTAGISIPTTSGKNPGPPGDGADDITSL